MAFRVYIKWKSVLKRWGCKPRDVSKRVQNHMRHSISIQSWLWHFYEREQAKKKLHEFLAGLLWRKQLDNNAESTFDKLTKMKNRFRD